MARFGYITHSRQIGSLPLTQPDESLKAYLGRLSPEQWDGFKTVCRDLNLDKETLFQSIDED